MTFSITLILMMALIGELAFMVINAMARRLRVGGGSSRAVLGAYGLALPIWAGAVAYFAMNGQLVLHWPYLLCVAVWLGVSYALNFGTVFINSFQSLSEGTGYRFGFSVILALLIDVLVFKTSFSPELLLVLGALFAGGVILHLGRAKQDYKHTRLVPLHLKMGFVALVSVAEVAAYALFKYGATMQGSIFAHNALSQALLFAMFLVMAGRIMMRDNKDGYLPLPYIVGFMVLVLVGVSANAVALAALPITLFIMFTLVRAAVFTVQDIKARDVGFSVSTILALVLIAAGIALAMTLKGF